MEKSIWRLALYHKRAFGETGLNVSPLGLGTVKLGRNIGVKYPKKFVIPNDKEAIDLIYKAKDLGINLIDTAPSYGNSEERLGELLKDTRNEWIICSKVGEEFKDGRSQFNFSPRHTRFSVERSLRRLDTDAIDIILVHSDGNDEDIITNFGILEVLSDLKKEGKIKAFGMSCKTLKGGLLAAKKSDGVMVTWNLGYKEDVPIINYCTENNKGIFIKKALDSGNAVLSTETGSIRKSFDMILKHQGVSSIIIGTINPIHLTNNALLAEKILVSE